MLGLTVRKGFRGERIKGIMSIEKEAEGLLDGLLKGA